MRKFLFFLILLGITMLSARSVHARKVDAAEALSRLNNSRSLPGKFKSQRSSLQLKKVVKNTSSDEATVYIFQSQDDGSFAVLPADDSLPPLLGYGDELGDVDQLPPAFLWWLSQYTAESVKTVAASATSTKTAISPLIKTKWGQNDPFNQMVPYTTANGKTRSATGCVATAMAQVMYYHQYPAKGTGSNTYTYDYKSGSGSNTLTMDFSNTTFNWSNMLTSYGNNASTIQKNAVATLMYACGIGVNMRYGSSSTAKTVAVVAALGEYFGYSSDMRYYYRDYIDSYEEWEDLIYGSLERERPVIYSGGNDSSGHSFICDGYKGDGYFHFNWGWSGTSDGYFLLTDLNPKEQGTGGSDSGYNDRNLIITDIHPAAEGETFTYGQQPFMYYNGDLVYQDGVFHGSESSAGFYNRAPNTVTFDIGVKAVAENGDETVVYTRVAKECKSGGGVSGITLSEIDVPNGKYAFYPVYRLQDEETPQVMAHDNGTTDHVDLYVNSKAISTDPGVISGVEETAFGDLQLTLCDSELRISGVAEKTEVRIYTIAGTEAMASQSVSADATLDLSSLAPGVYIISARSHSAARTLRLRR